MCPNERELSYTIIKMSKENKNKTKSTNVNLLWPINKELNKSSRKSNILGKLLKIFFQ